MKKLRPITRILIALSAVMLVSAYFIPLWRILMWAPQYPEGLEMKIWIDNITGDVKIISALNHYIGMRHIEVSMFPEFGFMIYILAFVIAFGLIAALSNRQWMGIAYAIILLLCGVAALVDFYLWGYDYGHNLDPNAAIVVPGMAYQPPVIGTKQLLNFTAFSGPDIGGWIFLAAGIIAIAAVTVDVYKNKKSMKRTFAVLSLALMLTACQVEPEPLQYGEDACHTCKMTLMDPKFGAELVSSKGKVYKFDDVNCMMNFFNSGEVSDRGYAYKLVVDFSNPGALIPAADAFYLKSPEIKSPMASQVAAFASKEKLDEIQKELPGVYLVWGELVTQYK